MPFTSGGIDGHLSWPSATVIIPAAQPAQKWDLVKHVNLSPAESWKDLRYEETGMYFLEGEVRSLSLRECASPDVKAILNTLIS